MCINILYPKVMIVLSVLVFLIDLESVENLLNVMDLQKVNVTRENVMHPAKKESVTYLPNSMTYLPNSMTYLPNSVTYLPSSVKYLPNSVTYLPNNERRHVRQGKLHVACIPMKTMKPIKNHILY